MSSVDENADNVLYEGAFHFNGSKGSSSTFLYNSKGALIGDASKGITHIDYDNNNNPIRIQFADGNVTKYVYSPLGVKLRTIHYTAVPNLTVPIGSTHTLSNAEIQYVDSTDYLLSGHLIVENGKIDKYIFDGGYCQINNTRLCKPNIFNRNITPSYLTFQYFNRDHLGNIREVIDSKGNVIESTNYYPFGTPFAHEDTSIQPFKYNGKELDKVHGLNTYDYGARQYNSVLCQWTSIDPLCHKYYTFSPYVYCVDNPVNAIDPDGKVIHPFLYRTIDSNKPEPYTSMSNFITAMEIFGQTEFGHQILSELNHQGVSHYGVSGKNNLDDVTLDILEFNMPMPLVGNDPQLYYLNDGNGKPVYANIGLYNVDGQLAIEFYIDARNRTVGSYLETIIHEFTFHLGNFEDILKKYREEGADSAVKEYYKTSEEQNHSNSKNRTLYNKTSKEALKDHPEYIKEFNSNHSYYE